MTVEAPFPVEVIKEGEAKIAVPKGFEDEDPAHLPVFYNPRSKISRDVAVVATAAYFKGKKVEFIEPLTGLGVRAVRLLIEAGVFEEGIAGDLDANAVALAKMNVELNGLSEKLDVRSAEANALLSELASLGKRAYYVDIDPYGSPAPFLDNALRACKKGGMIGASATDLAALGGIAADTAKWRYAVNSFKTFFPREIAMRTLVYFLVATAARLELAAEPLLTFHYRHFVRVFARVEKGVSKAEKLLGNVGYLQACNRCNVIRTVKSLDDLASCCELCGSRYSSLGPIWLGKTSSEEFLECISSVELLETQTYHEARKLIGYLVEELHDVPYYFPVSLLSRLAKKPTPKPAELIEKLRASGYKASLTHHERAAIKTDAEINEVLKYFG